MKLIFVIFLLKNSIIFGQSNKLFTNRNNLDSIEFYLETFDIGDDIYNNFAHNALRIKDRNLNIDLIYDWGVFDFGKPLSFAFNFYRGILNYRLGIKHYNISEYIVEKRSVYEDKLDLNQGQKRVLLKLIEENLEPENIYYSYKYFSDNCSTRIRDYLDIALGGSISKKTKTIDTHDTYRSAVNKGFATNPFVNLSLRILLNSRLDSNMTLWNKMFLPMTLRQALKSKEIGINAFSHENTIARFPQPKKPPFTGLGAMTIWFYLGMILVGVLCIFSKLLTKSYGMQSTAFAKRVFFILGVTIFPIAIFCGIFGLLMPLNWIFSDHLDLHHNANIALILPFDFLLSGISGVWLFKQSPLVVSFRTWFWFRFYLIVHTTSIIILCLLDFLGYIEQDISDILMFFGPYSVITFILYYNFGVNINLDTIKEIT